MADMDKAPQAQPDLDDLFAAARDARPAMPDHLTAAILQDAARQQAGSRPPAGQANRRSGRWAVLGQLIVAIGGWPAMGGLVAASAAGMWIGLAPPDFLPDPGALAGLGDDRQVMPYDGYEMAMMLSEELQ
jgi:hypothetical protein